MNIRNLREIGTILTSAFIEMLFFRKKLPSNPKSIQKLLVIKLDHIGDILLATPVFRNLHENYPEAEIDILVGSWSRPIVENIPYINQIWVYDSRFFCRSSNKTSFSEWFKLAKEMRGRKYELIVELRGVLPTAIASFGFSKYRINRATLQFKKKIGKILGSDSSKFEHEVERNLHLLEYHGIHVNSRKTFFDIAEEKISWAKSFLEREIGNFKIIAAIHPGSPVPLKHWSYSKYSELADILIEGRNFQVIFLGTEDEKAIIEEIQSKMRHDSLSLAGKTDLQELGAILQNCVLFIGNDSGPMHIASAVGTKTIGLFGPGNPKRFGPYGEHCYTIRKTKCPPCLAEKCKLGIKCIDEITVSDVLELIDSLGFY